MDKKWKIFIAVISVVIVVLVVEGFFLYRNIKSTNKEVVVLELPDELTSGFNPTENTPVFRIESIEKENKTLNMKFVYPKSLEGTSTKALIKCDDGVKILTSVQGKDVTEEIVSSDILFSKLQSINFDNSIFRGLCSDIKCIMINKSCELSLYKND